MGAREEVEKKRRKLRFLKVAEQNENAPANTKEMIQNFRCTKPQIKELHSFAEEDTGGGKLGNT
jgi:hypothetical protein